MSFFTNENVSFDRYPKDDRLIPSSIRVYKFYKYNYLHLDETIYYTPTYGYSIVQKSPIISDIILKFSLLFNILIKQFTIYNFTLLLIRYLNLLLKKKKKFLTQKGKWNTGGNIHFHIMACRNIS